MHGEKLKERRFKMKKYIFIVILLIGGVCSMVYLISKNREIYDYGIMYSWNNDIFESSNSLEILENNNIKVVYQFFNKDNFDYDLLKKYKDIEFYYLCGERDWIDDDISFIKEEIDYVYEVNKKESILKGIVFDVEPYVENKDNFDFKKYVRAFEKAYKYASSKGIKMIICIPTWFNTIDDELLEKLIFNSDGVSLMNYDTKYTLENIKEEVEYAKKYNKEINTIYELDFNKDYFKSMDEIKEDFSRIEKHYDYDELYIAYHYFSDLIDK